MKVIKKLKGHTGTITSIIVSKDGQRMYSSSIDSNINIWDGKNFKYL